MKAILPRSPDAWVFWAAFLTFGYFYQGGGFNEAARFDTIRSFLETGGMAVDRYAGNSADLIRLGGSFYSSKAPGTFLVGAPVFWASERVFRLAPLSLDLRYHLACYATTALTIGLTAALGAVAVARTVRAMGASARDAAAVALALVFGSGLFPFATLFMSHAATAACFFAAFGLVLRMKLGSVASLATEPAEKALRGALRRRGRAFASCFAFGMLLSFAITLEYPAAIGAAILLAYALAALRAPELRAAFWTAVPLGLIIGAMPMAWHNWVAFKNAFYIPYEAYRAPENSMFEAHRHGLLGIRIALFEPSYWPRFFSHLWSISFAPIRGLFYGSPVLLIALPALAVTAQRGAPWRAENAAAAAMLLAYLAMAASFGESIEYWGGGASYGPRHVLPALFFLAIPLAQALKGSAGRRAFAVLAPLSVFFCLMATSVEPRAPYEPSNPIFGFYAPRFFSGELAQNPHGIFSSSPIVGGSVAFSWGKLIGLSGAFQLFPLYALWVGLAFALDRSLRDGRKDFVRVAATLGGTLAFLQGTSS